MSDASYRTIRIIDDYQKAFSAVNQHFLHAEISSEILQKVNLYLHEQGCHGDNTLFAQSVCSDEINFESGDISDVFTKRFGEVFELGGLGGIPFVDKSGFAAYSNHVPKGNLQLK